MGSCFSKRSLPKTEKEQILLNEAKRYIQNNGFKDLLEFYRSQVKKWKEFEFNFALIGSNRIEASNKTRSRSYENLDSSADATETTPLFSCVESHTKVPIDQPNSENLKIKVWDLRSKCCSSSCCCLPSKCCSSLFCCLPLAHCLPSSCCSCSTCCSSSTCCLPASCSHLSCCYSFCCFSPFSCNCSKRVFDAFVIFAESAITDQEKQLAEDVSENVQKPVFILIQADQQTTGDKEQTLEIVKHSVKDESGVYEIHSQDAERLYKDVILTFVKRQKDLFLQSLKEAICVKIFEQVLQKHGVTCALDFFSSHLIPTWINAKINLAITGDSGTGKSSFVNAVRGIKDCDKEAAKVGVTETTLKPTAYSHPENENIVYWDLPGIGTPRFPNVEVYCRKIGDLEKYDAFLIFCKTRFNNHHKELAEKVSKELKKPFFFVRTKVDYDLKNAKEDEGAKYNEASVLDKMKKNCSENLEGLINDEKDIYMIDNEFTEKYEFQRLKKSIAEALPNEKKEEFSIFLPKLTSNIIKIKANFLRGQVSLVTVLFLIAESELAALVELVLKEVIRYYDVFGFHKNSRKSEEQLREEINQHYSQEGAAIEAESFYKEQWVRKCLKKFIDEIEQDASKTKDKDKEVRKNNNSQLV